MGSSHTLGGMAAAVVLRVVVSPLLSLCTLPSKQCRWSLLLALHTPQACRAVPVWALLAYTVARVIATTALAVGSKWGLLLQQQLFKCLQLLPRQLQCMPAMLLHIMRRDMLHRAVPYGRWVLNYACWRVRKLH